MTNSVIKLYFPPGLGVSLTLETARFNNNNMIVILKRCLVLSWQRWIFESIMIAWHICDAASTQRNLAHGESLKSRWIGSNDRFLTSEDISNIFRKYPFLISSSWNYGSGSIIIPTMDCISCAWRHVQWLCVWYGERCGAGNLALVPLRYYYMV